MERRTISPRADWQAKVEELGLVWHSANGQPYWDESAYYAFSMAEIDEIEGATAELYRLFIEAGSRIVEYGSILAAFGIPEHCHAAIRSAWNDEPPALNYGRFDLGYRGDGPPKLFEFNCDTPTSLLEASVIQWAWKEEAFPRADQFNSIHEKLVAKWADIRTLLPGRHVHFTGTQDAAGEDLVTVAYLRDTAKEAGIEGSQIVIDDIGWDETGKRFVDMENRPITACYKLYPWEWLMHEQFAPKLLESLDRTIWIEPIWKMIWSNKAILPVLWEMFPNHPNLLRAEFDPAGMKDYVQKPKLAREGANISIVRGAVVSDRSSGEYGEEGFVYQDIYELPGAGEQRPVIGSWIVDGAPAGMGIREAGAITGNCARFVPHIIAA